MSAVTEDLERLARIDPSVADRDELAELVATSARVRGWLDALDVRCARRGRELAEQGRAEPAESLLGRCGSRSSKDAAAITDRERVGAAMESFEASLSGGNVSAGHLDAIAHAVRHLEAELRAEFSLHEADLLAHAANESVDVFARRCRSLARLLIAANATSDADELDRQRAAARIKRWVSSHDGMHHTHIALDPRRDATLLKSLNGAVARRRQLDGNARTPYHQLEVDAFIDLVTGGAIDETLVEMAGMAGVAVAGASTDDDPVAIDRMVERIDRRIPEICVHVDVDTLRDGLHARSVCETDDGVALPVSTVRRMCCDAEVIPVVLDGDGRPLDVGRSRRTATIDQRRGLRSMHRSCAHPDCTVPFSQTRAHHIDWWTRDRGPTDIDNLLPLCERHHHAVHEGGWTVHMTPDRVATWTRPDGAVHHVGTTIDRHPTSATVAA